MKKKLSKIFALLIVMTMIASPVAAQPALSSVPSSSPDEQPDFQPVDDFQPIGNPNARVIGEIKGETGPATYIIQLSDAALASYQGGVDGLAATYAPSGGQIKLDVDAPESAAYINYLDAQQASFIEAMEETIGRVNMDIKFQYKYAFNGLATVLNSDEAAQVAQMPDVRMVKQEAILQPATDVSPEFLGADAIWDGSATGGLPTKGEGVIIGVLDTGINFDSPSFDEVGPVDGYVHINPYGSGTYVGWCDPANPNWDVSYACNDKLIGAWDFVDTPGGEVDGPWDHHSHGSHTASTSGGNVITTTIDAPTTSYTPTLSGMAPHANIIAYDVCDDGGCPESGSIAATDQAVLDGVDVINFSIGGGSSDPWQDAGAVAFLGAVDAGVIVVTSAGNDGPGAATMGSPADAPWMLAVGNSTHNRVFENSLMNMSGGGGGSPPADMLGKGLTDGYGPALIVYAGDYPSTLTDDPNLCGVGVLGDFVSPWPPGTFSGEIVVCDRGEFGRVEKGANVLAAGAGGFVLANVDAQGESTNGDPHELPGVHIGDTAGDVLRAWLGSGNGHMATISGYTLDTTGYLADIMAAGSSRGPNPSVPDIIKPDIAAPGTDILAAYRTGDDYDLMSGTSMASPHVAGAAALMRALYPNWSVTEIRSALMTTSWTDMLKEDHTTAADPFDMGAGRVDLNYSALAGLVLDETVTNFEDADPSLGGDPSTLNIASFADNQCLQECEWTRVVSSTLPSSVDWTAVITAPTGMTVTVTPSSFSLGAYAQQTITVTTDVAGSPADVWSFAEFALEPATAGIPDAHFPIAVVPSAGIFPETVDIKTRRNAGSVMLEDLESIEITDLTIEAFGLIAQTVDEFSVYEVPDNTMDFPDIFFQANVYSSELTVSAGDLRLVAEIIETTSPDLDMLVVYDSNDNGIPEAADIDGNECQSASGGSMEACDILNPVAGRWFAMVLNYTETGSPPDDVTMYTAVVPGSDSGNMMVTGPSAVPELTQFDLQLFWDTPGILSGDRYYGAFSLGTDAGNPGNIATIPVTISRFEDDVVKTVSSDEAVAGGTITYTVSVNPNVMPEDLAYVITDTLPTGFTYVPGSAAASQGVVGVSGNIITWTLDMPVPLLGYNMTTSGTDPFCDTGFGGYVNLEASGIFAQSGITGDTVGWTTFALQNPIDFYGVAYTGIGFTDDGFAIFDFANYGGSPWVPQTLPDAAVPNNLIAGLWQDMEIFYDAGLNHGVSLASNGPDMSIIEYDNIQFFGGGADQWDFEFIINSRSDAPNAYEFIVAYDNISGTLAGPLTIGIENLDGTQGVSLVNNGDATGVISDGFMVCFDYQALGADLATLSYEVTVDEGASGTITNVVEHQTDNPGSEVTETSTDVFVTSYGVDLSEDDALSGEPGDVVTYTLMVTNTGNLADTIDVAITGTWTATTSVMSVTLEAGAMTSFDVAVTIPAEAGDGNMDVTTVTVSSDSAPTIMDKADLTTSAVIPEFIIYLPLIFK